MPYCAKCGHTVSGTEAFCQSCGAQQVPVQVAPPAAGPLYAAAQPPQVYGYAPQPGMDLYLVYTPGFNLAALPPNRIEQLKAHQLREFPTAVVVLLHFLTLGIFTTIYHGLKHSLLPPARYDDFRAGKAIGFLFIPFFNLYWLFVFWLRLADRINLQFRLRGMPDGVSRGLVLTTCILALIPYIGLISFLILAPIMSGQIQSATNRLALIALQQHGSPALYPSPGQLS